MSTEGSDLYFFGAKFHVSHLSTHNYLNRTGHIIEHLTALKLFHHRSCDLSNRNFTPNGCTEKQIPVVILTTAKRLKVTKMSTVQSLSVTLLYQIQLNRSVCRFCKNWSKKNIFKFFSLTLLAVLTFERIFSYMYHFLNSLLVHQLSSSPCLIN